MLELLFRDLQYGLRMIRRSPGFTAIAVLSLRTGHRREYRYFTLIDAVMLRPCPCNPQRSLFRSATFRALAA